MNRLENGNNQTHFVTLFLSARLTLITHPTALLWSILNASFPTEDGMPHLPRGDQNGAVLLNLFPTARKQ